MRKCIVWFAVVIACLTSNGVLADCTQQQLHNAADSRFMLNKGEAFDKSTKLTWRRCSEGTTWKDGAGCIGSPQLMTFDKAKQFANQVGKGWRLPTIQELYSIVEQECSDPAINSVIFPDDIRDSGEGAPYWSITRYEDVPTLIYYINFMNGSVDAHSGGFEMAVRLVRNTQ